MTTKYTDIYRVYYCKTRSNQKIVEGELFSNDRRDYRVLQIIEENNKTIEYVLTPYTGTYSIDNDGNILIKFK